MKYSLAFMAALKSSSPDSSAALKLMLARVATLPRRTVFYISEILYPRVLISAQISETSASAPQSLQLRT